MRRRQLLAFALTVSIASIASATLYADKWKNMNRYLAVYYYDPPGSSNELKQKLDKWRARAREDLKTIKKSSNVKVVAWRNDVIDKTHGKQSLDLMRYVHKKTNRAVRYIEDYDHYGKKDYWASPMRTLNSGGDCEDIALLKATALFLHGWPREKMFLLVGYIKYRGVKTAHAVLAVEANDNIYILDNVQSDIIPFRKYKMKPLYAVGAFDTVIFKKS